MRLVITLLFAGFMLSGYSQGCSDAGFCTMGAMKPDQNYSRRVAIKLRSIEFNYYRGTSLISPIIYAANVDFNLALTDRSSLQIKLPYQWIKGNLGENAGLGDISLSYTTNLKTTKKWSFNGTLGTKIPTNDANAKVNNEFTNGQATPLHMYYQTSLGSFDGIAGFSMINQKWLLATGIQMAFTENGNEFIWGGFPNYPGLDSTPEEFAEGVEYVQRYNTGIHLKRGTDVMFRLERNFKFTNFNFTFGALSIYRITKDNVLKPATPQRAEHREDLDGTLGLALSVIGTFGYQFDVNSSIKVIQGIKLVDRDVNPDGLTRNEVFSLSYVYKF
ncbi:MAG: hypothetical protein ABJP45_01715 [Cyclobacteriaceae bacterium]